MENNNDGDEDHNIDEAFDMSGIYTTLLFGLGTIIRSVETSTSTS